MKTTHHISEFAAVLAAYAAGQTVHWKHDGCRLAGGPHVTGIVVQFPANGHCCGLFHMDGETSSYDPADFIIVPLARSIEDHLRINQAFMVEAEQKIEELRESKDRIAERAEAIRCELVDVTRQRAELITALTDCAESLSRLPDVDGACRATCYQQAVKTLADVIAPTKP